MTTAHTQIPWDKDAQEKYNRMIVRIPLFHRTIADKVAHKRAELNAHERGASVVEESDIVRAFLTEVPMAFYSLMIKIMNDVGFNYQPYEKE